MAVENQALALHLKVAAADVNGVAEILDRDSALLQSAWGDQTPLHAAILGPSVSMVELLIARGADLESTDRDRLTPLQLAVALERPDHARLLVDAGAAVDIFSAAALGLIETITALLNESPELVTAVDPSGDTPLHKACAAGQEDAARLLLRAGAALGARDNEDCTPLRHALSRRQSSMVALLVEMGASLDVGDAAAMGSMDRLTAFLDADPSLVHHFDSEGRTPLHRAAEFGQLEAARLLIERGAGVNAGCTSDVTRDTLPASIRSGDRRLEWPPVHLAISNDHIELVRLLMESGARLDSRNIQGCTPLLLAAKQGFTEALIDLVEAGASLSDAASEDFQWFSELARRKRSKRPYRARHPVKSVQSMGNTALHFAAARGDVDAIRFLLARGADKEAQQVLGFTALRQAIWSGQQEAAKALLDGGVRASGAQLAMSRGYPALVEMLLRHGDRINSNLFTVLATAAELEIILELPVDVVSGIRRTAASISRLSKNDRDLAYRSIVIAEALARKNAGEQPSRHRRADPLHAPLLEQIGQSGQPEIFAAAYASKRDDVVEVLQVEPDAVNARDIMFRTPLHWAADTLPYEEARIQVKSMEIAKAAGSDSLTTDVSDHAAKAAMDEERGKMALLLLEHGASVDAEEATGETPLHKAARAGYLGLVELLIDHGADVDHRAGCCGTTPLQAAASGKAADAVKLLLEHGASVKLRNLKGETALHSAASAANNDAIHFLLDQGIPIDARSSHGHTALHAAASTGNKTTIMDLLSAGASPLTRDRKGRTPLFWAVEKGQLEAAKLLLDSGAEASTPSRRGVTPLDRAIRKDHAGLIELLKRWQEPGARERAAEESFNRLLDDAVSAILDQNLERLTALLQSSPRLAHASGRDQRTLLHAAARAGNREAACLLIESGAPLDPQDQSGFTPLDLAAQAGHRSVCELFVSAGSAPNAFAAAALGLSDRLSKLIRDNPGLLSLRNEWGDTLLHTAVAAGYRGTVGLLLERGADIDAPGRLGWTPIFKAVNAGDEGMVELLRSRGAKVDFNTAAAIGDCRALADMLRSGPELVFLLDHYLRTPIFHAVRHGQTAAARLLHEHGAELDVRDGLGWTPLHQAVHSDQLDAAGWLLDARAAIDLRDRSGRTPLHLAAEEGRVRIMALLLERGAGPNVTDSLPVSARPKLGDDELDVRARLVRVPPGESDQPRDRTPLFYAVKGDHLKAIEYLLDHGASINVRDRLELTPLHVAAVQGNLEACRLLRDRGADPSILGGLRQTAAEMAAERGSKSLVFPPGQFDEGQADQKRYDEIARLLRAPLHPPAGSGG